MESIRPFIIYKSSAGSGKTYTLTLEYLKLALGSPGAFRQILAVTFTNKATQEMKERILEFLERISREVRPEEFLDQELMRHLEIDDKTLSERAKNTLLDILHSYGYFSVSTIDSFFQKVIRSFAREMDLQAKFDIELDQQAVLDRLVDRVVEKVSEDQNLKQWLVEYAKDQIENGKSWDVRLGIKELGREIFQEKFKLHRESFQTALEKEDFVQELRAYIFQQRSILVQIALEIKEKANAIRERNGLDWADFSGGKGNSNFAGKFEKFGDQIHPFPTFTEKQLVNIDSVEGWYTKTSKKKDSISAAVDGGLRSLIIDALPLRTRWNTLDALLKNLRVYGVFRNLILELRELKDEEGILLISDVNDFLKEITKDNEAPFIYEKIGNQYKHFLIDEFQDTSDFQWSSFKPLLLNSLASGNTNLLVGDVKQSIYRWRGGKLELLLNEVEQQIGSAMIEVKNLDVNFRSLPKVIDFNNTLFGNLPEWMQQLIQSDFQVDAGNMLGQAFAEVRQQVPQKKRALPFQGFIHLEFTEKEYRRSANHENDEDAEEQEEIEVLDKIPELVERLQDKGYALKDIAFLVRKNQEGAQIADKLIDYARENKGNGYGYDVLSEESLFIHRSAAVKALISLLKYLRDQEDQVAIKTCFYYYALFHKIPYTHELFELGGLATEIQSKQRQLETHVGKWLQQPLLELVDVLIQFLELTDAGTDLAYISGFKEAVFDFVKKNRADLAGFLDWWELNKDKQTVKIPEDHDAMRILTIHKSKGLQYKVILMPFVDWKVVATGNQAPILWSPWQEEDLQAVMPLSHNKDLSQTAFESLYSEEVKLAYLDSLNMLYVAFTRAEEIIWGHANYITSKSSGISTKTTGGILYTLFEEGQFCTSMGEEAIWNSESKVFEFGEWPELKEKEKDFSKKELLLNWGYTEWSSRLKTKEYAWDFGHIGIQDRSERKIGVLVHEILENSNTLKEALSLVTQYSFEGRFEEQVKVELEKQLKDLFSTSQFRNWYSGEYKAFAEQGILLPGGAQRRPDRILISEKEVIVLDFKTGVKKDSHQVQVREYMQLLGQIVPLVVKGYLCYLEPTQIIEVYG
ncbi:MAG: DNA helicase UvrD [Mongoliibacter sp.]|uniref:UvrD-helicase domain-containing protein n=1 Tax=Mongoliibacter sp. TaxID=2022438 RepID=UPI0012F2839B|nr:UvrD-helicase domain-containing protein [Mongoliibacter sp.]TVP44841.1 MAG: DNA helicase UvrD [Mongoliibacter sp.]